MTKKFLYTVLFLALLLNFTAISFAHANPPEITAEGAILIEAKTGRVIYEKNADKKLMPASTTKIMTAILAIENTNLTDQVLISRNAAETEALNVPLETNNKIDIENLLRALLLESDNGCAVAIAEHISGNEKNFAHFMNQKAKEIGCENTNFITANGLPNDMHLSTARDMAKISAYAMQKPKFREIVETKNLNMFWISPKNKIAPLENTNKLLWNFKGATGIKTGWTNKAQGCLAASARRNGLELIAVVLKSESSETRFDDAAKLLEYGFSRVKLAKGPIKEHLEKGVWVKNGISHIITVRPIQDVVYPLLKGDKLENYTIDYKMPKIVTAPIKKGDKIGELTLKYKEKQVGKIDLVATTDAPDGFSILSYFVVGLMYYFGVR